MEGVSAKARAVRIDVLSVGLSHERPQTMPRYASAGYNADTNDQERRHPVVSSGPHSLAGDSRLLSASKASDRRVGERFEACRDLCVKPRATQSCVAMRSSSTIRTMVTREVPSHSAM